MADEGEDKGTGTTPPNERGPRGTREQTEWTASDARGPLNAAADPEGATPEPVPTEPLAAGHADAGTPHEPLREEPSQDPIQHSIHEHSIHEHSVDEPTSAAPVTGSSSREESRPVPVVAIVLGLIVGAIIGAGSAALMYAYGGGGTDTSQVASLSARVDALEKRPDAQPEIDALKSQIAALPKTQAFDPAPLQDKVAGLQSDVDALKQKKTGDPALDQKVDSLGGTVDALKAQGADVKGLDGKVAALSTEVDGLKKQGLDGKVAALAAVVDGLKKQDDAQQGGLAALQTGQKALEGKVATPALAVVADSLVEAIAQGKPYAGQVDALASLGADPAKVAVLRENADKGVPSSQALAQKFAPLADPIMATAAKAPPNAGLMDRLKSGMMSMVSVRSADATSGDDVGSRVSRIEADLTHGDVAGAYATWDALPADAKAKSEAWGALAKTHVEAMGAARGLQAQAIAALGTKKS